MREKLRRQRLKESLSTLTDSKRKQLVDNIRSKCRDRVKKFREKKQLIQSDPKITSSGHTKLSNIVQENRNLAECKSVQFQNSYNTKSALAKATSKLRVMLPRSPSKRKAIIARLLNSLDDDTREEVSLNKTKMKKGGRKGIASKLSEEIIHFYERDDISRMSPNTKDARFYRNPTTGESEMKQKRYLVLTLKQAYEKFAMENAGEFRLKQCFPTRFFIKFQDRFHFDCGLVHAKRRFFLICRKIPR